MAADKTIFQCPVYTLYTQLDGAQRMIIQPSSGATFDYGVPLSLLAQWLFSTYQIGISGGASNPDPAAGNNGDIYFQTNGQVKQKIGSGWFLKANIPTGGAVPPTPVNVTAGDSQPLTIPYTGLSNPFAIFRNADGTRYGGATDQDTGTAIVITGNNDGSGGFADSFVVIVKA